MENVIACCGLNCAVCDARIATLANDDQLRAQTAEKWGAQYHAPITHEMINCTGCREAGAKFSHCSSCQIRTCADSKNFRTCAECSEMENCAILGQVLSFVPEARENLRSLN